MSEFDSVKYKNDFNKQNYDRIAIMVPKGKKEEIKAAAKARGKSMNEFIVTALEVYMNQL